VAPKEMGGAVEEDKQEALGMRLARRVLWGTLGISVVLSALFGMSILSGKDSVRAGAADTEILPSLSSTSPTYVPSLILLKGGQYAGNTPCNPGDTDATTACLHIWAKNVNNSTGASAFEVGVGYPTNGLIVSYVEPKTAWLGSTQRSVACPSPTYSPGLILVSCNTLTAPPPYGPSCSNGHCSGELATIAVESQSTVGIYTINLSQGTHLVDTVTTQPPPAIPATVRSVNVVVAPCADFTGDGTVRVGDILYVVSKYATSDPAADLNGSGSVRVDDILIAIAEYHVDCTR